MVIYSPAARLVGSTARRTVTELGGSKPLLSARCISSLIVCSAVIGLVALNSRVWVSLTPVVASTVRFAGITVGAVGAGSTSFELVCAWAVLPGKRQIVSNTKPVSHNRFMVFSMSLPTSLIGLRQSRGGGGRIVRP